MNNLENIRGQLASFFEEQTAESINKTLQEVQLSLFLSTDYQEWGSHHQAMAYSLLIDISGLLKELEDLIKN